MTRLHSNAFIGQNIAWNRVISHYFLKVGHRWISSGEINQITLAQSMTSNLGKIIKLYGNGAAFAGNSFASQGAVQAQIWSLGHRNLLGIDWDARGVSGRSRWGPWAATSST